MDNIDVWLDTLYQGIQHYKFAGSLTFICVFLAVKKSVLFVIRRRSKLRGEDKRHQINTIQQLSNAGMFVVLLVIWSTEIQYFAISIAAFMVAIVFATKEFIQCLIGFIYYLTAKPFRVGEWVQLDKDTFGEVVQIDWTKTLLLEIHPDDLDFTGKHLHVPNSKLITHSTKNLNFLKRYKLHTFEVTLESHIPVQNFIDRFQGIAERACADFHDVALRYKAVIERQLDAEFINVEPILMFTTNQFAKQVVSVTLFCPTDAVVSVQQQITVDMFRLISEESTFKNTRSESSQICYM
jgi:small-conductance mechanosensitive channel